MMAADVGFLATTQSGPNSRGRRGLTFATDRVTHRNMAIASMSVTVPLSGANVVSNTSVPSR